MSSQLNNRNADEGQQLLMFVVDVLKHDIEPLPSVIKMLNNEGSIGWRHFWPHDFTQAEVDGALVELVRRKWVEVLEYSQSANQLDLTERAANFSAEPLRFWFRLTDDGKQAWENWQPPMESEG